jgi:gamma-glutamyltranspeptidase/glutathione hydrolase
MVVTEAGGVMPFGTPGGDVQTQAMLQVLLNVFQHGMELQDAIEAPRIASYSFPSSFAPFEYFPGRLAAEGRIDPAVRGPRRSRPRRVKVAGVDLAGRLGRGGAARSGQWADRVRVLMRRPAYAIAI